MKKATHKSVLSTAAMASTALVLLLALLWGRGQDIDAATGYLYIGSNTQFDLINDNSGTGWVWDAISETITLKSGYTVESINIRTCIHKAVNRLNSKAA